MSLTTGQMLQNRYRIVTLLGKGGMGAVYRAWDTRLNVPVAVKELVPQPGLDAITLDRLHKQFIQEAQVLARLHHPHLVDVTDYFEERGKAYLVMRYVEGESLADRIEQEGALEEAEVLKWAVQLLTALAYCHDRKVLHRDLKPQNVILTPKGQVVLVDFGLVKLWDPNDPRTRTAIRGAGTPEYAPPEQYDTVAEHTDERSDIYSLGATLYHALTGQAPPTATQRMADPEYFAPPRDINMGVSQETEMVVLQAMAIARSERFQSAAEMHRALALGSPSYTPIRDQVESTSDEWWHRVPVWGWSVVLILVLFSLAMGVIALGNDRHTPSPDIVQTTDTLTELTLSIEDPTTGSAPTPENTPTPSPTFTQTPIPSATPTPSRCNGVDRDETEPPLWWTEPRMSGDAVVRLQTRLVDLGYELPEAGIDGWYGPETEAAVKEFQRRNWLEVDGYVGPITWACIKSPFAAPAE